MNIEDPEIRGFALGNLPELAMKHNRFACFEPPNIAELQAGVDTGKALEYLGLDSFFNLGYELGYLCRPVDTG